METKRHGEWVAAGQEWLGTARIPTLVEELWADLGRHASDPIFIHHHPDAAPMPWWLSAIALLIIADEACADLGYGTTRQFGGEGTTCTSWVYDSWYSSQERVYEELTEKARAEGTQITFFPQTSTVCRRADPDVVCVQPKSRTPAMGCTLRTFSHNLALLPPRGVVRACWQRPPGPLTSDDDAALNLLLIPYPFQVSAQSFKGHVRLTPEQADASGVVNAMPWGWFELQQPWLKGNERRDALVAFTVELIERSMQDVGFLHGIVFPELALDWPIYKVIAETVHADFRPSSSSSAAPARIARTRLPTWPCPVCSRGGQTIRTDWRKRSRSAGPSITDGAWTKRRSPPTPSRPPSTRA